MTSNEISVWDLFGVIKRHLLLFGLGFLILLTTVVVVTFAAPRKYRSEAQLQLKLGRENLAMDAVSALADQASVSMAQTPDQEINTVANVLRSRNIAENVVEQLTPQVILGEESDGWIDNLMNNQPNLAAGFSPYHLLSEADQAIWKIQDKIKIRPVKESNTIMIHYDSRDAAVSQKIVDSYVKQYLKEHRRIHHVKGSEKFLNKVVRRNLDQLEQKQAELELFRDENMLVAVSEQRTAIVGRRSQVKSDLIAAKASQKSMSAEVKALRDTLGSLDATMKTAITSGAASKAATEMRSQLFELEITQQQLLAQYDENHSRVKAVQQQIAEVKRVLAEEINQRTDIVEGPSGSFLEANRLLIEKKASLEGLNERIAELKSALQQLDTELRDLNTNEIKIDQLERDILIARSNYQKYKIEAEQARVDEAFTDEEISNVRVVPASLDPFPVFPIVPLNLAIGLMLGIFGGVASAFAAEFRTNRLRPASTADSNIPILTPETAQAANSVNGHGEISNAPEAPQNSGKAACSGQPISAGVS